MARPDVARIAFRHPDGPGALVEVLRLSDLRARALDHPLHAPQLRDFHMTFVVTAGRGRHFFEFGAVDLRKGSVLHVRPGQIDWFDAGSRHEALLLIFPPEAVEATSAARLRLHNPMHPRPRDFQRIEALARLIDDCHRQAALRDTTLHLLAAFVAALDALDAQASSELHQDDRLMLCERFEQLLERQVEQHRSVSWYAERLAVSTKTLARATQSVFLCSPKHYIDRKVTLLAKRLLVHGKQTIETIAVTLGFSEPTNFVKFFRRIEACTPQAFRQRLHEQGLIRPAE